jgi:hypothetical protein
VSVFDLQPKLNGSRAAGTCNRAKSASKWPFASRATYRTERRTQGRSESARPAGLLKNVAVEDVKELCSEIEICPLSEQPSSLTQCEVLVSAAKRACTIKRTTLITEGERET